MFKMLKLDNVLFLFSDNPINIYGNSVFGTNHIWLAVSSELSLMEQN